MPCRSSHLASTTAPSPTIELIITVPAPTTAPRPTTEPFHPGSRFDPGALHQHRATDNGPGPDAGTGPDRRTTIDRRFAGHHGTRHDQPPPRAIRRGRQGGRGRLARHQVR